MSLQRNVVINSTLSAPTKIEGLTVGSDEKKKHSAAPPGIPGGAALCFFFSSDLTVSSSIFVGAERVENLIRNFPTRERVCNLVTFS